MSPLKLSRADADDRSVWWTQFLTFFRRFFREVGRNRLVLFWSLVFPSAFYVLTVYLFTDSGSLPEEVVPWVMAILALSFGSFGAVIVCLNAFGQHLTVDIAEDRYTEFRSMPVRPSADFAGRTAAGLAFALVSLAVVLVVSLAFDASYGVRSPASLLVVPLTVGAIAVMWMVVAVVVAVVVRNARYASILTLGAAFVLYFTSGFNGTAPGSFAGELSLLNLLPHTLPTRLLVHHLVLPDSYEAVGVAPPALPTGVADVGLLVAYAVVALVVGLVVFRSVLYDEGVTP